jgi:hypothetical protein
LDRCRQIAQNLCNLEAMQKRNIGYILAGVFGGLAACCQSKGNLHPEHEALARAMAAGDIHAIRAAVEIAQRKMGSSAGLPEVADTFKVVPANAQRLPAEEARRGFLPHF